MLFKRAIMRRFIYSTNKVKSPEFFANMCNITGTEEITSMEFSDYVKDNYGLDLEDLNDDDYEKYFQEYREAVDDASDTANEVDISEEASTEYALDVNLDADISMRSDGSWDFVDLSWAQCAETEDGSWYTSDGVLLTTPKQLVDDINSLLQLYLPIEQGTLNVTGNIHLAYNMDEDVAEFDIANSSVENFNSKMEK